MNTRSERLRGRWTLGLVLIGGSLFGFMFDWEAISAVLSHSRYPYSGAHGAMAALGMLLGGYLLPVAIAFIAPRKSFLWAAAALAVGLAWSLVDRVVALNGPGLVQDFFDNGSAALFTLLVLCGPISIVRLLIRRRRVGKLRRVAEQQAWMLHQAAEAQAGVWPPPIKRAD